MLRIPDEEIHIEHGDFAHMDLAYVGLEGQFSAFTSQLVFLHIADKESLFEKCASPTTLQEPERRRRLRICCGFLGYKAPHTNGASYGKQRSQSSGAATGAARLSGRAAIS